VPVVVMTTRAGETSLARRLGVRHYITKPVDERSFVRTVESVAAGERALEGVGSARAGSLVE
jgi:DNA-binding NarL/FixJ family response regulator